MLVDHNGELINLSSNTILSIRKVNENRIEVNTVNYKLYFSVSYYKVPELLGLVDFNKYDICSKSEIEEKLND